MIWSCYHNKDNIDASLTILLNLLVLCTLCNAISTPCQWCCFLHLVDLQDDLIGHSVYSIIHVADHGLFAKLLAPLSSGMMEITNCCEYRVHNVRLFLWRFACAFRSVSAYIGG